MLKDCPRCYRLLEEIALDNLRVDACPGCGGVWFDEGELARLAQTGAAALRQLEDRYRGLGLGGRRAEVLCPVCRKPLMRSAFPHAPQTELDSCRACRGVWVDEGELAALADSIDRMARKRA